MTVVLKATSQIRPYAASPLFHTDDNQLRVAIREDGLVAFASTSFCELVRRPHDLVQGVPASDVFTFTDGAVTIDNAADKPSRNIVIKGSAELLDFSFEWLDMADGRRFLIGSPRNMATRQAVPLRMTAMTGDDFIVLDGLSDDILMVIDVGTRMVSRMNDTAKQMFPGFATAVIFENLFDEGANDAVTDVINTLVTGRDGGGGLSCETRIQDKNDTHRILQWNMKRRGQFIYARARDVTAIKQQEQALRRREEELSQAESIGRMGHWHWQVGADGVEWSDELYHIFGVDRQGFQPTLDSINAMVSRRDLPRVSQAFQRAMIEQNNYNMDFRINRPDGSVRYIRCEGRCAVDEEGDIVALYGIMQDVTERALHEQQLKEAKNGAERAYAAKTQFLANMSHELRTPLNAIIGFSEMMQQQLLGPIGNEKYLEYISGIRESGGHLLDLISDILDMSKIEAGKYELALEEFKIYKTLRMAMHMMEGRAREGGVVLNFSVSPREDLSLVADRRAFMQITLNLLSNAVKFTREGGKVMLECHEREDYLALKVIDTGIGIPANKLATITKPFEQVSSSYAREHEGSGLGLAITKELVEMHGGNLHIESTVDVGTTVTVRLPYDAYKTKQSRNA